MSAYIKFESGEIFSGVEQMEEWFFYILNENNEFNKKVEKEQDSIAEWEKFHSPNSYPRYFAGKNTAQALCQRVFKAMYELQSSTLHNFRRAAKFFKKIYEEIKSLKMLLNWYFTISWISTHTQKWRSIQTKWFLTNSDV